MTRARTRFIAAHRTPGHGGHPVLRWMFENVAVEVDKAGNKTFHKGKSRDRTDAGVVHNYGSQKVTTEEESDGRGGRRAVVVVHEQIGAGMQSTKGRQAMRNYGVRPP